MTLALPNSLPHLASDLLLQELIGSALRGELLGLEEWQTVTSVLADPPHASFELLSASAADVNTIRINFSEAILSFAGLPPTADDLTILIDGEPLNNPLEDQTAMPELVQVPR